MNDSFNRIFATVPLGSIVAFSDGTERPPERFKRKLRDWQRDNGAGRLVAKKASEGRGEWDRDSVTLHLGDYGGGGTIVLRTFQTFNSASQRAFTVLEYIAAGRFVLLTHSQFVGTEFKGSFATLEEARADIERGHRYSDCGIYRVGEAGALELAEGLDGPKVAEVAA